MFKRQESEMEGHRHPVSPQKKSPAEEKAFKSISCLGVLGASRKKREKRARNISVQTQAGDCGSEAYRGKLQPPAVLVKQKRKTDSKAKEPLEGGTQSLTGVSLPISS